jgi:hypothetical protein
MLISKEFVKKLINQQIQRLSILISGRIYFSEVIYRATNLDDQMIN